MKTLLPLLLLLTMVSASTPPRQAAPAARALINMSLRAHVPEASQIISGFVLEQNGTVIIRAAGPALGGFGVANAMSDPVLEIWQSGRMIAMNDNWDNTSIPQAGTVGAFPFVPGSKDAAIRITLAEGAYTAIIKESPASTNRTGREVLLEIYDATAAQ